MLSHRPSGESIRQMYIRIYVHRCTCISMSVWVSPWSLAHPMYMHPMYMHCMYMHRMGIALEPSTSVWVCRYGYMGCLSTWPIDLTCHLCLSTWSLTCVGHIHTRLMQPPSAQSYLTSQSTRMQVPTSKCTIISKLTVHTHASPNLQVHNHI